MAYPPYIRARARELRVAHRLTINEIAERLALPKTTIYYWVRDLPLGRARRENPYPGTRAMMAKYKRLRDQAYARGAAEYDQLVLLPTFRDFVVLYIAEGSKRDRNYVAICNSDERIIAMASGWLRQLTPKPLTYAVQYHVDQNLEELRDFWSKILQIDGSIIRMQQKSNSGQLNGRTWRSAHGVLAVRVTDTYLRARLQAWIDRVRMEWGLDSCHLSGRGAVW